MPLTPGDVAIVAYNADGKDEFAWVPLVDIPANTGINFTDASWTSTGFLPSEIINGQALSWTHTSTVSAGTVIRWNGSSLKTWSLGTASGSAPVIWDAGDQIFAFTGTIANPTFIYGAMVASTSNWSSSGTSSILSRLPTSLVNGFTGIRLGNFDNGYYQGPITGSKSTLLAAIANPANWQRRDSNGSNNNGSYPAFNWVSTFTVLPEPDLSIGQTDTPDPVVIGNLLTYTLTVSNTGGSTANGVVVNYSLPAGVTFNDTTVSNGFTAQRIGNLIRFSGGSISAGSQATLTVRVTPATPGTLTSGVATVDPTNVIVELNETNNTAAAIATTTIVSVADVVAVSSPVADGIYRAGAVIPIAIAFDEVVNVTGVPQLTLETGATDAVISYTGGSGTSTLTFTYTVASGHTSADLDYISIAALGLNGGTIRNGTGTDALLNLPAPGTPNSLGATTNLAIDTTMPDLLTLTPSTTWITDETANGDNFTVTLTYGEVMNTGVQPLITFPGLDNTLAFASGQWQDSTTFVATFTANDTNQSRSAVQVQVSGAQDLAGNVQIPVTLPDLLRIDTENPVAPTISQIRGGQGLDPTNGITNDSSLVITGTAEANSTVDVWQGNQLIATTTTNAQGLWRVDYATTHLPDGNYDFSARSTDTNGNQSDRSSVWTVTIDRDRPTVSVSSTAPSKVDAPFEATINFSEPVIGFTVADLLVENGTVSDWSGSDGTYTVTVNPSGQGTVTVILPDNVAQDKAGNGNLAAVSFSRLITSPPTPELPVDPTPEVPAITPVDPTPEVPAIIPVDPTPQVLPAIPVVPTSEVPAIPVDLTPEMPPIPVHSTPEMPFVGVVDPVPVNQPSRTSVVEDKPDTLIAGGESAGIMGIPLKPIYLNPQKMGVQRTGTRHADRFQGDWKQNRLQGGRGNDRLLGGLSEAAFGKDCLYGGEGDDYLYGGGGRDFLSGDGGNDRLMGGDRRDILVGGEGNDTLTGGNHKDMFVYNSLTAGTDLITDFQSRLDVIDLRPIFAAPEFGGNTSFDRFQQFVKLERHGAHTQVKVDADGSGIGTNWITLVTLQTIRPNTVSSRNFVVT